MKLYEIDAALEAVLENGWYVDEQTGEYFDASNLDALVMARKDKLEGVACWIKGLDAEADELEAEEKKLNERRKRTEKQAARLREWLQTALAGEKLKTSKVEISYRRSKSVKLDSTFDIDWLAARYPELVKTKTEPIKAEIKKAIDGGEFIPGAEIAETVSMTIK